MPDEPLIPEERMDELVSLVNRTFSGPPRDPERIERMLSMLRALWTSYPDMRLTQLVVNLTDRHAPDVFYFEDNDLEQRLRDVLKNGWVR